MEAFEILAKFDEAQKVLDYLKPEIQLRDLLWLVIDDLRVYLNVELNDEVDHMVDTADTTLFYVSDLYELTECIRKTFEDYLVNHYGDD